MIVLGLQVKFCILGAFVTGLEFSTGKTAHVVGKPEKSFFLAALEAVNREQGSELIPGGRSNLFYT